MKPTNYIDWDNLKNIPFFLCQVVEDKVYYKGSLINGTLFEYNFKEEIDFEIAEPRRMAVGGKYGVITGLATALQYMKIGDRWEIYIPENFRQTRWNVQCSCYTQVWRGTACFVCRVYQYLYAGAMWIPRFFLMYSEHEYKQLNFRDMKKKIKLYIAVSLDGYIARPDGNLDWLTKYPMPTGTEYGYKDLMDSIDTIIMGGKTYRAVLDMDFEWPYSDKACYIVSHRNTNLTPTKNVKFITENVVETVKALKQQDGKDIWLVGGGQVITLLLNHDLVDEMQICYIPVILGNGIPLFPNQPKESTWKFAGSEAYDSGIVKITYVIG